MQISAIDASYMRWRLFLERQLRVACADPTHRSKFAVVCDVDIACDHGEIDKQDRDEICERILSAITIGSPPRRAFAWHYSPASWDLCHWHIVHESISKQDPDCRAGHEPRQQCAHPMC